MGINLVLFLQKKYNKFLRKKEDIAKATLDFKEKRLTPKDNDYLISLGTKELKDGVSLYDLLKRQRLGLMI